MSDIETIFGEALRVTSTDRAAFLDRTCGVNSPLRREVEALLRAHQQASHFMEAPAPGVIEHVRGASPGEPAAAQEVGSVIGPYKLLQQIGEGGMGVVYMAEQLHPVQ